MSQDSPGIPSVVTTLLATSDTSTASRLFSAGDRNDAAARNTTQRAGSYRVEGLVRDNRVEVRVLFGAPHERPRTAGLFAFLSRCTGRRGEHLAATPLTTGEQPCSPLFSNREAAMSDAARVGSSTTSTHRAGIPP